MSVHNIPITPDEYNLLSCYPWPCKFSVWHYTSRAKSIYKRVLIIDSTDARQLHNSLIESFKRNVSTWSKPEQRGITSLLTQLQKCA